MIDERERRQFESIDVGPHLLLPTLRLRRNIICVDGKCLVKIIRTRHHQRERIIRLACAVREAVVERHARHGRHILVERAHLIGVQFG